MLICMLCKFLGYLEKIRMLSIGSVRICSSFSSRLRRKNEIVTGLSSRLGRESQVLTLIFN